MEDTQKIWAHVEVVGRRTYWGQIPLAALSGSGSPLIRVDIPGFDETTVRERGYFYDESIEGIGAAYGVFDVTYAQVIASVVYVGAGSIYMLTPTSEEQARKGAFKMATRTILRAKRVDAEQLALPSGSAAIDDDDQEDGEEEPF